MPTTWVDNFYLMDPSAPPAAGTSLTATNFTVRDGNSNGQLTAYTNDKIDGSKFYASYPGDTVTVSLPGGSTTTVTGVTFYLYDGRVVFSPIDGSTLSNATFVSSTWSPTSQPVTPAQMQMVVCFAAGTLIGVPGGTCPAESLRPGDLIETLDNGAQQLRWIGRRTVPGRGDFAPVRFMPGAIGNDRALRVSPQHRMLVSGWRTELNFGESEMLVAAKHLVNGDTIHFAPCAAIEYVHLCFDRHEIVLAEGVPAESFLPGDYTLRRDRGIARELAALFPELEHERCPGWAPVRPLVRAREAMLLA